MPEYYAGVGSRETPASVQSIMTDIARYLEGKGYTLRSGGADGADTAFEKGVKVFKEIYLPWKGFNRNKSGLCTVTKEAYELARQHHPAWANCNFGARKLHARNVYQVLGFDLVTPSKFVVCWTSDGKATGGTGMAIRIAESRKIPVYNLHDMTVRDAILKCMEKGEDFVFERIDNGSIDNWQP